MLNLPENLLVTRSGNSFRQLVMPFEVLAEGVVQGLRATGTPMRGTV